MKIPQRLLHAFLATAFAVSAPWHAAAAPLGDRMVNISARANVGTNGNELIGGFVITGTGSKKILISGIGPRLAEVGIPGTLVDPVLTLYNVQGVPIATNDNWSSVDAATLAGVGGGPFTVGSKDAVLVVTLDPGVYSAIIKGANNGTGEGMVEVYDVSDTPKFINLSARAVVGANPLIAGVVVGPGTGTRRLLIRAAGPVLTGVGVAGALSDPKLTIYNGTGAIIATNDNWGTNDLATLATYQQQAGATPFPTGSRDSAVVVDVAPGNYSMHVTGVGGVTGVTVVEAFDITPAALTGTTVSVAATSTTTTAGSAPAVFTLTRQGDTSAALTVGYTMSGTAASGTDYTALSGTATFAAGAGTTTVSLTALPATSGGASKTATLALATGTGYTLGSGASASVTLYFGTGTLYVANLRPTSAAVTSTAYGTATIQLSADEKYLTISSGFSSLSSAQTVSYLRLAPPGGQQVDLLLLPAGQVVGTVWPIQATGNYTVASIAAALKAGQLIVSIETVNFPSGELNGTFIQSAGSQTFTAPPAPPTLPATLPTQTEAARFLMQATFGPKQTDIDSLVTKSYSTWITEQMALPATSHRTATLDDYAIAPGNGNILAPNPGNRQAAWWKIAITGNDQLRQRTAFALSEIFVISDSGSSISNFQEAMAAYYDILANNSFGNFRTLLEQVTLNPLMGIYLSSLRNSKSQLIAGTTTYTSPDENYAREVMQLFTIGLNELQPDGTLKLGTDGLPISTYNQTTISETAKVFTGWGYYSTAQNPVFSRGPTDYFNPMMMYQGSHETSAKTIVGGKVIPANQTGQQDLKDTLDALFNHANTGPFISRQLIQRLVTSNPSPAYVYRVAQVFANNGSGVRGDLGAVVRAILTDYEARSSAVAANAGFGKLKEPLMRVSGVLRAFNATPAGNGRYAYTFADQNLAQAALRAPTVFNFFEPAYIMPGELAAAGLYAPEYQILTDTTAITVPNQLHAFVYNTPSSQGSLVFNDFNIDTIYTAVLPLATQPSALVDQLNLLLCAGAADAAQKASIATVLTGMPTGNTTNDTNRVKSAVYLLITTPLGAIQK